MKNLYLPTTLLIILVLAGCEQAAIEGQVFDAFSKPLSGVRVSISNSAFSSITDDNGDYSVEYVPGVVSVNLSKDGYSSASFEINITEKATFPAARVNLYELPKEKGLYIVGDNEYIKLMQVAINKEHKKLPFSHATPHDITTLKLPDTAFNSEPIAAAGQLQIIDTEAGANARSLFESWIQGYLLETQITSVTFGKNIGPIKKKEELNEISPGVYLRRTSLHPGLYVFASTSEGIFGDVIDARKKAFLVNVRPSRPDDYVTNKSKEFVGFLESLVIDKCINNSNRWSELRTELSNDEEYTQQYNARSGSGGDYFISDDYHFKTFYDDLPFDVTVYISPKSTYCGVGVLANNYEDTALNISDVEGMLTELDVNSDKELSRQFIKSDLSYESTTWLKTDFNIAGGLTVKITYTKDVEDSEDGKTRYVSVTVRGENIPDNI